MQIKKAPIKPGDIHLVVADSESKALSEMKVFDSEGRVLHNLPCLAKGQTADYSIQRGDTPPGLYRIGRLHITQPHESTHVWNAFGKYFLDMEGQQQNEEQYGRQGCGIHGGGTGAPDPLAPYQKLMLTWGCIRVRNADLEKIIIPLYRETIAAGKTVWLTVHQF